MKLVNWKKNLVIREGENMLLYELSWSYKLYTYWNDQFNHCSIIIIIIIITTTNNHLF